MEIFVAGVNKIRKIQGLTQEQLAEKIPGGKRGTVSSWLRGRTRMADERKIDFSIALGVSIDEIMEVGRKEQSKNVKTDTNGDHCDTCPEKVFKLNEPLEGKHLSIIRKFKNKHMACTLNELLVELEALDDSELACVVADVKNRIKELKNSTKKRTANGEN